MKAKSINRIYEMLKSDVEHTRYAYRTRMLEKIGKTVFLKREEAEQALADMQCK